MTINQKPANQSNDTYDLRRTLHKALNEISIGDPTTAERLIELAILQEAETAAAIERLVGALEYVEHRLEVNNCGGEEDEALEVIFSAVASVGGRSPT